MNNATDIRHPIQQSERDLYELRMECAEMKANALLAGAELDLSNLEGCIERTRQKLDTSHRILAEKGISV